MLRRIRSHLSYANVMATIAVFIALGGTGYAAHEQIFSSDIVDGEVRTPDIATDAVTQDKIRAGAVGRPEIGSAAVTSDKINAGAVNSSKVKDNDLTGDDILESSLGLIEGKGQALYNRVVQQAGSGFTGDILQVPGFGKVYAGCDDDPAGARTIFNNNTLDPVHVWVDDGAADPTNVVLQGGGGSTTIPTDAKGSDRVIFQVGRGVATDADHRLATIVVTSSHSAGTCIYQAQALAQTK
jgi:hypothetical protein